MKYEEVYSRAWQIVWKFKALWLFGILSSCARASNGSNGNGGGGGGGSSSLPGINGLAMPDLAWPGQINHWLLNLRRAWETDPWIGVLIVVAAIFLFTMIIVLSIFLGTLGRVGVARGTWLADNGSQKLSVGKIFEESKPYFWRVLLLLLLVFAAGLVVGLVIFLPIMLLTVLTVGLFLVVLIPVFIPLVLLMVVVAFAVNILLEESIVAIVGEDLGVFASIERAWKLLVNQPVPMLVNGVIITIGQMIVSFILVLPFILVLLPFLVSLVFQTEVAMGIGAGLSGLAFLVYLPVVVVLFGILYAYIGAVWTLIFRRLAGRKPVELQTV